MKKTLHFQYYTGIILIIIFLMSIQNVGAHSPIIVQDNTSLKTAHHVDAPTKSWVVYGDLSPGDTAAYFHFHMQKDERIFSQIIIPVKDAQADFVPYYMLMGPGLPQVGNSPLHVEVPENMGVLIVTGEKPSRATYEGFTPSSFYVIGEMDLNAPETGEFYLAVYGDEGSPGGHYGLVLGYRESFTLQEWILVPLNVLQIYLWEGYSPFFIILPLLIPPAAGILILAWRWQPRYQRYGFARLCGYLTGLLFVGTTCSIGIQAVASVSNTGLSPQVAITLVFAGLPLLMGVFSLQWALKNLEVFGWKQRAIFLMIASLGLMIWAGVLIGPLVALIGSIAPPWKKRGHQSPEP